MGKLTKKRGVDCISAESGWAIRARPLCAAASEATALGSRRRHLKAHKCNEVPLTPAPLFTLNVSHWSMGNLRFKNRNYSNCLLCCREAVNAWLSALLPAIDGCKDYPRLGFFVLNKSHVCSCCLGAGGLTLQVPTYELGGPWEGSLSSFLGGTLDAGPVLVSGGQNPFLLLLSGHLALL